MKSQREAQAVIVVFIGFADYSVFLSQTLVHSSPKSRATAFQMRAHCAPRANNIVPGNRLGDELMLPAETFEVAS